LGDFTTFQLILGRAITAPGRLSLLP